MLNVGHIEKLKEESGIDESSTIAGGLTSVATGVSFPYFDLSGQPIGTRIKLDATAPGGGKYHQDKGVQLNLYFAREDLTKIKDATIDLFLVEGEKKVLALRQTNPSGVVAGIPGCWGWSHDKSIATIFQEIPLQKRRVILIPDSDFFTKVHVWDGYLGFIRGLFDLGAHIHLVDIRLTNQGKVGIDDFLMTGGDLAARIGASYVFKRYDFAKEPAQYGPVEARMVIDASILLEGMDQLEPIAEVSKRAKLPKSYVEGELKKSHKRFFNKRPKTEYEKLAIEFDALRQDQRTLYGMIGDRLRAVGDFYEEGTTKNLVQKTATGLQYYHDGNDFAQRLSNVVPYSPGRFDQDGSFKSFGFQVLDPAQSNGFLKAHSEHTKLPILKQYTKNPVLVEHHGTYHLVGKPGYYEDFGVLHDGPEITPSASMDLVNKAFDYPWATDADRVTAIMAAIGAIFFRVPGRHPMIVAQGNHVNLGKSSYLKSIALLATGKLPGSADFKPRNEELAKEILAHMDEEFILLDNIRATTVSSQTLERLITDEIAELRILGTPKKKSRINTIQFMASLNGGCFSEDLITRSIPLFLDNKNKTGQKDLLPFVRENRLEILSQMMGMVDRWIKAGCPLKQTRDFEKFPGFGAILCGIAEVNGLRGCLSRLVEAKSKLDPFQSAFLEAAYEECDNLNSKQTRQRSVKDVVRWVTDLYGDAMFRDHPSLHGRYVYVGQRLTQMTDQQIPFQAYDRMVDLKLVMEEKKTTRPGNKLYSVQLDSVDSVSQMTLSKSNIADSKGKEGKNPVGGYKDGEGYTCDKEISEKNFIPCLATHHYILQEQKTHNSSLNIDNYIVDSVKNATLTDYPTTITTLPNESWFAAQSGEYTYEFKGTKYPSKWWSSEDLGSSFSFDIETEVDNHTNIKLASAFNGHCLYRIAPKFLKAFVEMHLDREWICHNAVFDLTNAFKAISLDPLVTLSFTDERRLKDTLMLSKLVSLAEGYPFGNSLGEVTKEYLDVEIPKDIEIKTGKKKKKISLCYGDYEDIHSAPAAFLHYNAFDAIATFFLWDPLHKKAQELCAEHNIAPEKLLSYDLLVQTSTCGGITSSFGMALDQPALAQKVSEITARLQTLEANLTAQGYRPGKNRKKTKGELSKTEEFESVLTRLEAEHNVSFSKKYHGGMKRLVFSQKAEDLESFSAIPFVSDYLEHESAQKTLSTFLAPLIGKERISSTYNAGKTTGRISSTKPNLQNIPRDGGIRELFIAGPGKKLIVADYSGAELQCAAQYAIENYGFSALGEKLKAGADVHRFVAAKYLNISESEVTKAQRQSGKVMNFGRFGGSGAATLMETAKRDYNTVLTLEETKALINVWDNLFPEAGEHFKAANKALMKAWGVTTKDEVWAIKNAASGKADDPNAWDKIAKIVGKHKSLHHWRDDVLRKRPSQELAKALERVRVSIVSTSGRVRGGCSYTEWCNNAALQGRQADITNLAWANLLKAGLKVVNVVHDEFIVECDEQNAEEIKTIVERIMVEAARWGNPEMTAMGAEISIKDRWEK